MPAVTILAVKALSICKPLREKHREKETELGRQSLGELELLVLLAAVRLGEDAAYAVSVADEIRERTGRPVQRATVYVTLQRLETKALVSTRLGDPLPERGGKARRYVKVEELGLKALRDSRAAFSNMWSGLEPSFGASS